MMGWSCQLREVCFLVGIHIIFFSICSLRVHCASVADMLIFSGQCSKFRRSILSKLWPSAAFFTSASAISLPCMPMCPAIQLSVSEYFAPHFFLICITVHRKFAARYCPGQVSSVCTAFTTAWLSALIVKDVVPVLSILMRCRPRRRLTNSASYTVCSSVVLRWQCSVWMGFSGHVRIAAAPTYPLCADLSVYTLTSCGAF